VEALFAICRVIKANPLEISPRLVNRVLDAKAAADGMAHAILKLGGEEDLSHLDAKILNMSEASERLQEASARQAQKIPGTYEISPQKFKQVPVIGKGMGGLPDTRNWT